MKKTLLLLLAVLCLAACKKEPDLPDDPHITLVNPFIGVWKAGSEYWHSESEYWQFRTDGTGGKAATAVGPFPDTFSFFVYAGQDAQTSPSTGTLVILEDSGGGVAVTYYSFMRIPEEVVIMALAPGGTTSANPLEQISGVPAPLNLINPLIGEWSAQWTGDHNEGNSFIWSLKYRADGTVKTYHHGTHQFENGYNLRGSTLVIYGDWRFSFQPVTAEINNTGSGTYHVTETQTSPPAAVTWEYTKVAAAEWK
jgi:hypothetical protein